MPEIKPRSDHSSGKWENFPAGLRVLVVDDDSLCLKVIGQMLRSCKYEVTTCMNSTKALDLLRDRRNDFDLVLSDVFMPDIDGFKLLETIGLELGLPVIMMSSSGDTSVVLKGVTHGAVDFLIKPVRVEELRNVWQHVVRKRKELGKDIEVDQCPRSREDGTACESSRKRKEGSKEGKGDDGCASKKPRVNWSVDMHQQFVNAVNQLGIDKAVPKKILELMSVKSLTRENVASHLQKYRLYLKRMRLVQAANLCSSTPCIGKPQQSMSEPPLNATVPNSGASANTGMFASPVPSPPGLLGTVPQAGIGNLIPALGPPNLASMQMQLQNMHLQGALSLGLDASSLVPPGAMLPPGLGLGMGIGTLNAHAFMGMGLMAGVQDGNGSQFQGLQHGMSRSASVSATVGMESTTDGEFRRHQSSVPACGETGSGGVVDDDPLPIPNLNNLSRDAIPTMLPKLTQLDSGVLPETSPGQQGKPPPSASAGSAVHMNLQVKQEDAGARNASQQLCGSLDLKLLEMQGRPGDTDATIATGFPSEEALLGLVGGIVDRDMGSFTNGEFGILGDGVPIEETKDMGMDEFLNAFLRETCAPHDTAGQC